MAVRYSGHWLRTRRQAGMQCVVLAAILLPLAAWRLTSQPIGMALGLAMLTLAPFTIAYQAWRFLENQERLHREPTAGMIFVFRLLVNTPLTLGALLFVVLMSIG
jgi:hypothetical protein